MELVMGRFTEKSLEGGLSYLLDGANHGSSKAMNLLGVIYTSGLGVERNVEMAKKWFKKAAKNGSLSAKQNLRALKRAKILGIGTLPHLVMTK